jgi:diguanylate cyclase (GGDEF)-like protein/PAS domain S-box-containing protein
MSDDILGAQTAICRRLFDMSRDLVCILTDGRIVAINGGGAERLGETPVSIVGRRLADLFHPDYRPIVEEAPELLTRGTALMKVMTADGGSFDAEVDLTVGDGHATGQSLLSIRDVSRQTGGTAEMVQDHHRFRRIVDLATDMILLVLDGRVQFVNPAGAHLLAGGSVSRVIGHPLAEFVHPDHRGLVAAGLEPLSRESHSVPLRLISVDGQVAEVELSVRALGDRPDFFLVDARDVTMLVRSSERLREREARLRGILDAVADGIVITGADGRVISFNPAAEAIFGCAAAEAVGQPIAQFIPEWANLAEDGLMDEVLNRSRSTFMSAHPEMVARRPGGTSVPIEVTVSALDLPEEPLLVIAARDITERRRAEERIRYQALHDALTGLPNRQVFMNRLDGVVRTNLHRGRMGALLIVDVDGLKLINDSLGYEIGDAVLGEVTRRLTASLSPDNFLARLGGNEFGVILHEMSDEHDASALARSLIEVIDQPVVVDTLEAQVTASVGIVRMPADGDDVAGLLRNASAALTQAREQGRGSLAFFTADLDRLLEERLRLRTGLSRALDNHEFALLYQPKVNIASGRICGVEALLRWDHGDHGLVPPTKFIPIMEDTSLIGPVGRWVLETACTQQREWVRQGHHNLRMAVNLSVRQMRPGLVPMVEEVLKDTDLEPDQLEIEITESLLMKDTEHAIAMLRTLADMGIQLSIDDFGTGYSSLSYLKRLPLHTIKIDRSFITELTDDTDAAEIVRTIITMARSLKRRTVAEGVETRGQLAMLREFGCDEIQGFLFSRPVAAANVREMLVAERDPDHRSAVSHTAVAP